jgi:transcriptional regulator with XRE-family HTH domain
MGVKNRKPTSEALWVLGTNLRKLRKARGFTQVYLSKRTGIPSKYISSIEHELKNISLANLEALAKGLECLICDLFMPIKEEHGPGTTEEGERGNHSSVRNQPEEDS